MTWAAARRLATVSLLAGLVASCAGSGAASSERSAPSPAGGDHGCINPGGARPHVAWTQLRNPVLSYADAAVKDQALVWAAGRWHMVFSYVTNDSPVSGDEHWGIATAESTDMTHWSAPVPWTDQPGGMASPDVVRSPDGRFVATYDSPPGEKGATQAKLYYRTSRDLVHWSAPHRLAPALRPALSTRLIDPALAWTTDGLVLAYKVGTTSQAQAFELAWSKSGSLSGPWSVIGRPAIRAYGDTFENYELVMVGGRWRLVATSNSFDQPWIFTLQGNPGQSSSWLRWVAGRELTVPSQTWDTGNGVSSVAYEHANSAYVCEDTADGYDYLTYAGSQELTHFGGWGHAKVGIARSKDLVHWSVPSDG